MNIHQMVSSKKKKNIMDVWFDSGSSHTGVMVERGFNYPVDLLFLKVVTNIVDGSTHH